MSGVSTPSDILDGLVGAIPQQTPAPAIIESGNAKEWIVDAQILIYDFLNYFELEDLYRPSQYSTLGGLILEEVRHIPSIGESLVWNNINLEIESMNGARIGKVRVTMP